ncbi:MAG: serine hydrolase [Candidatus Zhuqueibacterota bacterium]
MKKINGVLVLGVTLMMSACVNKTADWGELKNYITKEMEKYSAVVAVAFEDLQTGETFFFNETRQMHAASTMKTPVMIEVFRQMELGKFSLTDSLLVKNEFRSIVDSSVYSLDFGEDSDDAVYKNQGKKMSINDLVYQMITVSSNFATNLLVDLVSAKNIMQTMSEIGAKNIQVLRGVEDPKAYEQGLNNTTDAYDMMLVMKAIALKQVATPAACEKMTAVLLDQKFNNKIPALLPKEVKVAHKTGSITRIDHDAAIVFVKPDHACVLVVLTSGFDQHKDAEQVIAQISKMIYDKVS